MNQVEFIKAITYMGILFNKPIDKEVIETWYEFFSNIPEKILKESIKDLAKERKYLPSLQELLEKCRNTFNQKNHHILDLMYKEGYFRKGLYGELTPDHTFRNYEKSIMWSNENLLPNWLLEDMIKYGLKKSDILKSNDRLLLK